MTEQRLTDAQIEDLIRYYAREYTYSDVEKALRELKAARFEIEVLGQSLSDMHVEILRLEELVDEDVTNKPYVELVHPKGDGK